jgi:prophage antirepressor-like protein
MQYKNAHALLRQHAGTTGSLEASMSEEIVPQVFENSEFGTIRAMRDTNGEPWFVASDIAKALASARRRDARFAPLTRMTRTNSV